MLLYTDFIDSGMNYGLTRDRTQRQSRLLPPLFEGVTSYGESGTLSPYFFFLGGGGVQLNREFLNDMSNHIINFEFTRWVHVNTKVNYTVHVNFICFSQEPAGQF